MRFNISEPLQVEFDGQERAPPFARFAICFVLALAIAWPFVDNAFEALIVWLTDRGTSKGGGGD
ncbi:MAG: hypothetical protein AAGJ34_12790 [Pseudomonadota bacterium]